MAASPDPDPAPVPDPAPAPAPAPDDDPGADDEVVAGARAERLRFGWKACRYGFGCARADARARARALEAIAKLEARDSGSSPASVWRAILTGRDAESSLDLISNPDFFDLIDERQDFWRPLVACHPFAALIPGRTARERQAFLARLK